MIKGNIGKVSNLVLDMLNYSREKSPNLKSTDINRLVNDARKRKEKVRFILWTLDWSRRRNPGLPFF